MAQSKPTTPPASEPSTASPGNPGDRSQADETASPSAANAATLELKFTPPEPPSIEPMDPFPADPSLQETVDFIKNQMLAGHPEVIWYALPADIREALNSQEFRDALKPAMKQYAEMTKPIEGLLLKAVEILVTKKDFVLGSQAMQSVPPPIIAKVQQGYEPAVGLAYELIRFQFALGSSSNQP